jgi:predicted PurR-regulated permease PerM
VPYGSFRRHRWLRRPAEKIAEVIQRWRGLIPAWAAHWIPADADALQNSIVSWLQQHLAAVRMVGQGATQVTVHIVIGMVIGALIALRQADPPARYRPLAKALANRATRFGEAFRRVVFAQVRIAALNALLTALYLVLLLPLLGIHLPPQRTEDLDRRHLRGRTDSGLRKPDLSI